MNEKEGFLGRTRDNILQYRNRYEADAAKSCKTSETTASWI
jgi:hypothetical protein